MKRNTTHHLFTRLALIIGVQLSLMTVCQARDTAARTLSKAKPLYCGFRNHKSRVKNQDIRKIRLSKSVTPRRVKVQKRILNRSVDLSHRASTNQHRISGTFEIPASHRSLQDVQLRVHLYEYEPRKAGGQSTSRPQNFFVCYFSPPIGRMSSGGPAFRWAALPDLSLFRATGHYQW